MRLLWLHIENFGGLHQQDFSFQEGMNLLLRENGFGKSTLAAFIRAMFYGLSGDRRQDISENERKRYFPWQGGSFGGSLHFALSNREYRIERFFGEKRNQDSFALYDVATNLPSRDFSERIGEELFQINAEAFEKTVFFGQLRLRSEMNGEIHAKLGNVAEDSEDMRSFDRVAEKINGELNRLSPLRKTGEIYKERLRLEELSAELLKKPALERELLQLEEKLPQVRAQVRLKSERIEQLNQDMQKLSRERDSLLLSLRKQERERQRRLEELERAERARIEGQKKDKESIEREYRKSYERKLYARLLREMIFTGIGLLGLLTALIFLIFVLYFHLHWNVGGFRGAEALLMIGMVLFSFLFLLLSFSMRRRRKEESRKRDFAEAEDSGFETGEENFSDRVKVWSERAEDKQVKDTVLQKKLIEFQREDRSLEEISRNLKTELESLKSLQEELRNSEESLKSLRKDFQRIREREREKAEALRELAEHEKRYSNLELTGAYLKKAKESFALRYRKPMEEAFQSYYRSLLGSTDGSMPGETCPFYMDANLKLHLMQEGRERETVQLSEGYQDLISLCRRFAVIDSMYPGEKPFLILDDPFVNLDDDKKNAGLDFLQKCAEKYQLLYMTCSESRGIQS